MKTATQRSQVEGWYKIEAVKAGPDGLPDESTRRVAADWFQNLILDQGLDYLGGTVPFLVACQLGTGTAAPANAQTALSAYSRGTTTVQSSTSGAQASAPYYGWVQIKFRFSPPGTNDNYAEVGVGKTSTTGNLFSRARVQVAGVDGSISVLADEYLDVTYELRQYPPLVDDSFTITISGVDYDCVLRAAHVVAVSAWGGVAAPTGEATGNVAEILTYASTSTLGAITTGPTGGSGSIQIGSIGTYTPGNLYLDATVSWALNEGNESGGIGAVVMQGNRGAVQVSFDPVLAKDATKIMTLTFRQSWARRDPL